MYERNPAELRLWLPAVALAALTACHPAAVREPSPEHLPAPDPHPPADAAYDWHVLLIVPFGSVLKDIPLTLHEVLLFRDEAPGAAAGDDAECYASDGPAPRFAGITPDEYLLCFKHDRLSRVQASVRLGDPQPAVVFAAACADWQRRASPAPATAGAAGPGGTCEGSEGAVRFNARFDEDATLSIVLDALPET